MKRNSLSQALQAGESCKGRNFLVRPGLGAQHAKQKTSTTAVRLGRADSDRPTTDCLYTLPMDLYILAHSMVWRP